MRIASNQYQDMVVNALQNANAGLHHVTAQMASGQRVMLPSDDPITTVRLSRMSREEASIKQHRENIANLSTRLTQNEEGLSSLVEDMLQARDLLVWASNGSNTSEDVMAMAGTLVSLRESLFYTSNSKNQEGLYLYSGTLSNSDTVAYNAAAALGSRYSATGNTATQQVVVGDGVTQPANVTLPEMAALLNQLDSVIDTLQTAGVNINNPATRTVLENALKGVDDAQASVTSKIAKLGGIQTILATLDRNHSNVSVSNQQAMITLGQLDYAEAATRLSGYSTALQATQKSYAKVNGLSLFNVI